MSKIAYIQDTPTKGSPFIYYTIGLVETYHHPDICVLGVEEADGVQILEKVGELVKSGTMFDNDPAGQNFHEDLVRLAAGRPVVRDFPDQPGDDWNQVLKDSMMDDFDITPGV